MARMAAAHGTTELVATPHANEIYRFEPEQTSAALARLHAEVGDSLRLHSGCDFHLTWDNIEDAAAHPRKYTIAQQNYLLVEFSDLLIFKNTPEILGRLADAGMIPIVTHPERNDLLRMRLEEIAGWVAEGARVQVTAQSLTGGFGRRAQAFSRTLLDRGLVHVVASDAHDCERRPPVLDGARAWLARHYGEAVAEALCTVNPGRAIAGEPMTVPERNSSVPARKWYSFWR